MRIATIALMLVVSIALLFELFFRYDYVERDGMRWKIDRLTQRTCRLKDNNLRCAPISPSKSTSTSLSTSLSASEK
jgi:hypothetical protein